MNRRVLGWLQMLAFILSPAASAQPCSPGELFTLVAERLAQMPAVAAYKYAHKLPVSDPAREQKVWESVGAQALELGIPPARVRPFIHAQIEAAKVIQRQLIQEWERQGRQRVDSGADLIATIRPRLILLGQLQLQAIRCLRNQGSRVEPRHRQDFDATISGANLPTGTAEGLFQSLQLVAGH